MSKEGREMLYNENNIKLVSHSRVETTLTTALTFAFLLSVSQKIKGF